MTSSRKPGFAALARFSAWFECGGRLCLWVSQKRWVPTTTPTFRHTLELSANEQTENFLFFASSGAWVSHTHVDKHTNPPSLIAFSLSWVRSKDHQRPIARKIDHVGTRVKNLIKWITIFVAWVCHLSQYMETVASPFLINVWIWHHHYINMRLSFRIRPQYTSLTGLEDWTELYR